MSASNDPAPRPAAGTSPARRAKDRTPAGHRVLHVVIPVQVFNHVKAQAYLSDMPFPQYVALSLADCGVRKAAGNSPEQATTQGQVTSSATVG